MREIRGALLVFIGAIFLMGAMAQPVDVPAISDGDRAKIREMQLRDARLTVVILQRQIEINTLQQQQAQNAKDFQVFSSGLCKPPYEFDMGGDEPKCVEKPKSPPETGKK